jgi:hypothetical protein
MKTIPLTQGKVVLVDDADYERVIGLSWYVLHTRGRWYAAHHSVGRGRFYMHRFLLNAPADVQVDHWDMDGLNNQRYNLRLAPGSGNYGNRDKKCNNTSGFKGVHLHNGRYIRSRIKCEGRVYHIGYFATYEEAARAYDAKAVELFGEFARTNAMLGLL